LSDYSEVWLVDTEFHQPPGERPEPICLVGRELWTGFTLRMWQDELSEWPEPPYPVGPNSLFIAYLASAELGCHLSLGWALPECVLDLYVEFRHKCNGIDPPNGFGLLGALAYHGLDVMDAAEKRSMQQLAMRGPPFTDSERRALLAYCERDVNALEKLLRAMEPGIDLPRAVACRGRYMRAVARMEATGVPIDMPTLERLRDGWDLIQDGLIADVDQRFGVFEGRTFKAERWARWLGQHNLPWPVLESGELALDEDTFREMARTNSDVSLMHELRVSLSQLRLNGLTVGKDGRNRVMLSPFRAKTSRNQPSNTQFIFGPSTWVRGLIKPETDRSVAYLDWEQQEFGIAAYLSGDPVMIEGYASGDPYLSFGQQSGRIPTDATKRTHAMERELFKQVTLAVQYGMGEVSLAQRINQPVPYARDLLRLHHATYPRFWEWSDGAEMFAMLNGWLYTVFGWVRRVGRKDNPRSLRNFPCQANGAEMLRLACCLATERGINVAAPIHDALLIEAPTREIYNVVTEVQELMAKASALVLSGAELRADARIVEWPDRYMDERGRGFWNRVMDMLPSQEELIPFQRRRPIPAVYDPETGTVRGYVEWAGAF
jgi:hypothetical protein